MDEETLKRTADAARIALTDDELKEFKKDIDELFAVLNSIDDAPECGSLCFDPTGASDLLRDDVPVINDRIDDMLRQMGMYEGFVRGPKIV